MRKVRSAPQLAGMDARASLLAAAPPASPRHICAGAAGVQGLQQKAPVKAGLAKVAARHGRLSQSHRPQALMIDAPPAPPPASSSQSILSEAIEQADELLEEIVWARGLIPAGECFEQFGWTESAPPLKDVRQLQTDDQRRALASCLATPFMYDDEHLSRRLQDKVSKRSQENNRNLTNRYVQEVRDKQLEEDERDTSSYAGQQATSKARRRRRGNQALYKDHLQATAPALTGRSASPNTQRFLSRTLSSLQDNSNKLHYDESLLAEKKNNVSVSSSLDPASMTMDLPDAALFSMDDPKISSIDPKLSAGGVMEVSLDDNMLLAEQHSSSKKMNSNSGSDVLDTKDKRKEGTEAGEDMGVPALDKAADISTTAEDKNRSQEESSVSVRTPPRNNVVPFRRQQVPRS